MRDGFDPVELLAELKRTLDERKITGSIKVFGASALAHHYPNDQALRQTADVDALYRPKAEVEAVAVEIAETYNLSHRWLNDAVRSFVHDDAGQEGGLEFVVEFVSAHDLVALKMSRLNDRDISDLAVLVRNLPVAAPQDLVRIARDYFGDDSVILTESDDDLLLGAEDVFAAAEEQRASSRQPDE